MGPAILHCKIPLLAANQTWASSTQRGRRRRLVSINPSCLVATRPQPTNDSGRVSADSRAPSITKAADVSMATRGARNSSRAAERPVGQPIRPTSRRSQTRVTNFVLNSYETPNSLNESKLERQSKPITINASPRALHSSPLEARRSSSEPTTIANYSFALVAT